MRLRIGLRWLAGVALALASAGAAALGLGEIEVKSGPGQPFLAEIPIIAAEPGEIEGAQARLASPETFARVGLQPPQGLVGDLRFEVTRNAHGRAVVRVTSVAPVHEPALGFLIEVDWGRGRLVREYSALIDAPRAAEATQPVIETPMPLPSNRVPERQARVAEGVASTAPENATPVAAPASAVPAAMDTPPRAAAMTAGGDGAVTVAAGQTLYRIASEMHAGADGTTVSQWMIGLLRANPQAFMEGNINRLKAGAVLQAPARTDVQAMDRTEAQALVRDHIARWQSMQAPLPQPVDATGTPPDAAARSAAAVAPASADARLQIAPAAASGAGPAAPQSGAGTDRGGDMLTTEQLRQAREDLAARDAEMRELRDRVAELERLQQQQMQLIAMKDDDLAAAQQRLAQQQAQDAGAALPAWIWGVLAALVAALVGAWWFGRRRKPSPFERRPGGTEGPARVVPTVPVSSPASMPVPAPAATPGPTVAATGEAATSPFVPPLPWTAARAEAPLPPGPTWHRGDPMARVAPLNPAPAGRERLELAVAYLDLGDVETARDLLQEVVAGGDEALRAEATRLLQDLD